MPESRKCRDCGREYTGDRALCDDCWDLYEVVKSLAVNFPKKD
jgi:uncharacterized OB-fold protein